MLNTTRPFFKILAVAYCCLTCAGLAQSAPSASWNQASSPGFASGCLLASSANHFLDITRIDSHRNCREASEMFPFRELRIAPKVLLPGRGLKDRQKHTLRQK